VADSSAEYNQYSGLATSSAPADQTDNYYDVLDHDEEQEREDFVALLNSILWDEDSVGDAAADDDGSRQYKPPSVRQMIGFRGLMGQPMPDMLRNKDSLARTFYDEFTNTCYGLACVLGINKLAGQLGRLIG